MKKPDDKNIQILSNNQTNLNNCTINNNYNVNLGSVIFALVLLIILALIVSCLDPQTRSYFIQLLSKIVKD